jgi:catechol 2,3-dioxygenase-like lactoylglutathione lyase family enzyme
MAPAVPLRVGRAVSRVQLALNVSDLDAAVEFYSRLFGVEVHKRRDGYANFIVEDPPLKLALFEVEDRETGVSGALNHIGVEVMSSQEVAEHDARLGVQGLDVRRGEGVVCCHAEQDKIWLDDPNGLEWEIYTVTDETPDGKSLIDIQTCCG